MAQRAADGDPPLIMAANDGRLEDVRALLAAGTHPDAVTDSKVRVPILPKHKN